MNTTEGTTMTITVGDFVATKAGLKGRVVAIDGDEITVYHAGGLGEAKHSRSGVTKLEKKAKR